MSQTKFLVFYVYDLISLMILSSNKSMQTFFENFYRIRGSPRTHFQSPVGETPIWNSWFRWDLEVHWAKSHSPEEEAGARGGRNWPSSLSESVAKRRPELRCPDAQLMFFLLNAEKVQRGK